MKTCIECGVTTPNPGYTFVTDQHGTCSGPVCPACYQRWLQGGARWKVCWGTTRIVFLMWRWAIKVPAVTEWRLFLLGLLANMQEAKFSKMKSPAMCPVLFAFPGGFFSVMQRARELTREEFERLDYEVFINFNDYTVPVEKKLDSFGVLNGRVVAIDYGN